MIAYITCIYYLGLSRILIVQVPRYQQSDRRVGDIGGRVQRDDGDRLQQSLRED